MKKEISFRDYEQRMKKKEEGREEKRFSPKSLGKKRMKMKGENERK